MIMLNVARARASKFAAPCLHMCDCKEPGTALEICGVYFPDVSESGNDSVEFY